MKLRHPLHEFMPYGAPDLLVAHRPDLSRALSLSAVFAISAFVAVGALSTLAPRTIEKPEEVRFLLPVPPPVLLPIRTSPATAPPKATVRPASKFAMPNPVAIAPPDAPALPPGYDELAKQVQPDGNGRTGNPPVGPSTSFTPVEAPDLPATYADVWPVAVTEVKPEYPQIARDAMVDGQVVVLVLVGRDGRVREAKVDEHHHVLLLDEAALAAARKWVFSPALANGHAVSVWTAIPFDFILQ